MADGFVLFVFLARRPSAYGCITCETAKIQRLTRRRTARALMSAMGQKQTLGKVRLMAMFQMMGVFAEFERAMIAERVRAGVRRAKDEAQLRANKGILKVAREVGVGVGTVHRIKQEMTGPFADAAA